MEGCDGLPPSPPPNLVRDKMEVDEWFMNSVKPNALKL